MQLATVSTVSKYIWQKSPLHWNYASVEHYSQNTVMASYGEIEVKVFVTQLHSSLSDLGPKEACIPADHISRRSDRNLGILLSIHCT